MTTATTRARAGWGPRRTTAALGASRRRPSKPWRALWAMMVGFFMILVDATIVAVANPSIMTKLGAGYDTVIWVTSAYLLAYAVPLLVAGRLGDRFGMKNLYLIGLAVFTAASLWCGLSGSIGVLIAARVVQGVGAGLLTPQTLSMITRIFPPERRGVAMSVWGATAGVATLVGPLAGGALVDALGWEWIFFINVPVGIVGLALAVWLVPTLPTHDHRFDLVAVGLSGAGMFLIVFALQEGQSAGWAPWIWAVLVAGIGFAAAFVYWQSVNTREPLIPLEIFRDRYFSLSNIGVAVIGFSTTAMVLPLMFYAQAVCGLSPTRSALLMAPMAVTSGVLAPVAGKIVDKHHPGPVIGFGFSVLAIALTWLSIEMTPATPIWRLVLPFIAMGGGNAFIWSPLAATATRNLPPNVAGASSGVYNATRQVGAVLGSAGMAAFMTSRIGAEMPARAGGRAPGAAGSVLQLPKFLREPFSAAMSQSTLLPAFVSLFGVAAALLMAGLVNSAIARRPGAARPHTDDAARKPPAGSAEQTERIPVARAAGDDDFVDDDDDDAYVEFTLAREPEPRRGFDAGVRPAGRRADDDTEPLGTRVEQLRPVPDDGQHSDPVESHQAFDEPDEVSTGAPIGFAHNGYHVDDEKRFLPIAQFPSPSAEPSAEAAQERRFFDDLDEPCANDARGSHARPVEEVSFDEISFEDLWYGNSSPYQSIEGEPPRNRHHRIDPDDSGGYRHSYPD